MKYKPPMILYRGMSAILTLYLNEGKPSKSDIRLNFLSSKKKNNLNETVMALKITTVNGK